MTNIIVKELIIECNYNSSNFNNKYPSESSFNIAIESNSKNIQFEMSSKDMEKFLKTKTFIKKIDLEKHYYKPPSKKIKKEEYGIFINENELIVNLNKDDEFKLLIKYDNHIINQLHKICASKWKIMKNRIQKIIDEINKRKNKRIPNKAIVFLININTDHRKINTEEELNEAYERYKKQNKYNDSIGGEWWLKTFHEHVKIGEECDFPLRINDIKKKYPEMISLMKRGDLIENIHQSGYRSQGVYCFDGEDLVCLNGKIDDYGTPSSSFKLITEFPPGYWDSPTECNIYELEYSSKFYWHDDETWNMINLSDFINIKEVVSENHKQFRFEYQDKKYAILVRKNVKLKQDLKLCVHWVPENNDSSIDYLLSTEY
jgi:hypothetical protein